MRLLFVSPHADDVCFSLYGTISSLRAEGDVATVFSESQWAEPEWPGERGRDAVTSARAAEDAAFCSAMGLERHALGFEDSSIRFELAGNLRRTDPDTDARTARVASRLATLLSEQRFSAVFAPLGLGDHTDHVVTARAAKVAAAGGGVPIVFYEDLPYVQELSERAIARAVRKVDRQLQPVIVVSDASDADKQQAAQRYASQRKEEILQSMIARSDVLRARCPDVTMQRIAERLWAVNSERLLRSIAGPDVMLFSEARGVASWLQTRRAVAV